MKSVNLPDKCLHKFAINNTKEISTDNYILVMQKMASLVFVKIPSDIFIFGEIKNEKRKKTN